MLFANKIVKNSKSNAIVLAKGKQLLASGVGQTSRVDALKQAIEKSQEFRLRPERCRDGIRRFLPPRLCGRLPKMKV